MAKKKTKSLGVVPEVPQPPSPVPAMSPNSHSLDAITKLANPFQPIIWVDGFSVTTRIDVPVGLIRFYSALPDAAIEVARIQMSGDVLKLLIDSCAAATAYYPKKPE